MDSWKMFKKIVIKWDQSSRVDDLGCNKQIITTRLNTCCLFMIIMLFKFYCLQKVARRQKRMPSWSFIFMEDGSRLQCIWIGHATWFLKEKENHWKSIEKDIRITILSITKEHNLSSFAKKPPRYGHFKTIMLIYFE